eukprot:15337280-Heterocapsa_arctica.AAC.1
MAQISRIWLGYQCPRFACAWTGAGELYVLASNTTAAPVFAGADPAEAFGFDLCNKASKELGRLLPTLSH